MDIAEREELRQVLHSRANAVADHLHHALASTGFVALSAQEITERLVAFVDRVIELLLAKRFDHREAQNLGSALARLYYSHPDALSRTQHLLAIDLLQGLSPEQRIELHPRLMEVISELAVGFLRRSRRTFLAEQESIRGALLTACQQTQDALRASEARFRAVFEEAAIGMGVGDTDGRILEINRALQIMMGYSIDEMRRMNVGQLTHPEDAVSVWGLYQGLIEGRVDSFRTEKRYFHKDGGTIWCNLTVSLVRDAEGIPQFQIAMMENITERKRAEEALEQSEARFRALVRNASDVITILDADGTIRYESPAIERVFGYQPEELVGRNAFELVHPDDLPSVAAAFAALLADPARVPTVELRFRHKDGSWRWLEATGTNLLADPAVGGVVVNSRDITERRESAAQLWHQAHHDSLTGLPNRALFLQRLEQALARRGPDPVAVLFLDLDGFKTVNDSLGHEYGDRLLAAAADRLAAHIRAGDTLARFGGDEFTLRLERTTDACEATRMAERLLKALAAPFTLNEHTLEVTASIGVVLSSPELATPTDLLRAADVALYRAKASGNGSVALFDATRDAPALVRLDQEIALRHALERGDLRLHYQPKVGLATGRTVGVEALVRWQHPSDGLLPPNAFIPLAEETGLIVPLGLWVLEQACRQVMAWDAQIPDADTLVLCVNISPVQIRHPGLVDGVERVLRETGFPPEHLVLEITEQGLVDATDATDRAVKSLFALGVQLAIDDFGAYQAGLGYLRRWPMDAIKLDRSLVAGLDRDERSRAIVAAVVALAKTLGMTVTGEGIETAAQLASLRELGCDYGQGFAFAPPLPPDALVALLEQGTGSLP